MSHGSLRSLASEVVRRVEPTLPLCSIGLFTDLAGARAFLATADKLAVLRELDASGRLVLDPSPVRPPGRTLAPPATPCVTPWLDITTARAPPGHAVTPWLDITTAHAPPGHAVTPWLDIWGFQDLGVLSVTA
jgi:hypothetical protein